MVNMVIILCICRTVFHGLVHKLVLSQPYIIIQYFIEILIYIPKSQENLEDIFIEL